MTTCAHPPKTTDLHLRTLAQLVSIVAVLADYQLLDGLRRRGDYLCGPCPLHGGDNPTAFRVHLGRGLWHCFSACGGGDVVELIQRLEGCTYPEAARHLQRLAAHPLLLPSHLAGGRPSPPTSGTAAERTFRPFRRTLALDPCCTFLQQGKAISPATAAAFEAGIPDPHSTFLRGTVAVRLHNLQGAPLGYCGRRLDPHDIQQRGKWRFPRAFPKAETLYNAHRAHTVRPRGIVVVECPWAVLRLAQAGWPGAVALLGTTLSPTQAEWLVQAPAVLLLLDADRAGRQAASLIARTLAPHTTVYIHRLPDGLEPEDRSDNQLHALVHNLLPFP